MRTVLEVPALEMVSEAPAAPNAKVPREVNTCGGGGVKNVPEEVKARGHPDRQCAILRCGCNLGMRLLLGDEGAISG